MPQVGDRYHFLKGELRHELGGLIAKQFVDEQQGTRLYLVEAVEIGTPASLQGESGSSEEGRSPHRPAGVTDSFAQRVAAVKGEAVSKVVHPIAGEPLVVYHGTNAEFTEFKPEFIGRTGAEDTKKGEAYFFSSSKLTAYTVAATDEDGELSIKETIPIAMPVYLNLRNPIVYSPAQWGKPDEIDTELLANAIEMAKEQGRDGVIWKSKAMGDAYVVFSPSQIKSATANQGTFDPTDPNILHQDTVNDDAKWLQWEPETTSTGKFKGSPEWVKTRADWNRLLHDMRKYTREGVTGRFWYEQSAKAIMRLVGGDVVKAEKLIQLIAIYSPKSNIWVNALQAVRAYSHWALGRPQGTFSFGSGDHDGKAIGVLYRNEKFYGRKTNSFYDNLMHDIIERYPDEIGKIGLDAEVVRRLSHPVTIDVWMGRAFGYQVEAFGDDKGEGKYSFAENTVRRITAELNSRLQPGEPRWKPHQVQAAIWTALKTRYEFKDVKAKTNAKSLKQGLLTYDDKGKLVYPEDGSDAKRKHLANWRHYAMQKTTEETTASAAVSARSFGNELDRMTNVVTWEAIPSTALHAAINRASLPVREQFTAEARAILMDEQGNDVLAAMLGVALSYATEGSGAFASTISPNVLSHLLPMRAKGQDGFSAEEVRAYARAIQYIYKQDAVPWFRPENKPLSQTEAHAQKFRVLRPNGTTARTFQTQDEATTYAATKGAGFTVRGGDLSRASVFRFQSSLTPARLQQFLGALREYLGPDAGFTRTASNELVVVNFRDDTTKLPFAITDEQFYDAVDVFLGDRQESLGITDHSKIWTEGEYGHVEAWTSTEGQEGERLLTEGSLGGRPDLHSWLRGRRVLFEDLLARYTEDQFRAIEQALADRDRLQQDVAADSALLSQTAATGDPRGSFNPATLETLLYKPGDVSTVQHELMHFYVEALLRLGAAPDATTAIKHDVQSLLALFKVPDIAAWAALDPQERNAHHEAFAYLGEQYLWEGKAPTPELESLFARLARWMRQVYRAIRDELNPIYKAQFGKDLPILTDEFRAVFDRMLGAEEAITRAESSRRFAPLFETQAQAKMDDTEWAAYRLLAQASQDDAIAHLTAASLKQVQWLSRAKSAKLKAMQAQHAEVRTGVRAEVAAQLAEEPVYRATRWLLTGSLTTPSGELVQATTGTDYKLSRTMLAERYPQGELTASLNFSELGVGSGGMMMAEGGLDPDLVATMFGYTSGDHLVRDLIEQPSLEEAIETKTDERMLQEHSDLADPAKVEIAITVALHNEARSRLVAVELRHAAKATQPVRLMTEAAKRAAVHIIDELAVRDVRPARYDHAETRAKALAVAAMSEGKEADAILQLRHRLLNAQLASVAAAD